MKKVILCIILVFLSSLQAFATSYEAINNKLFALERSVRKMADGIASYNKHIFEVQLTKKERIYHEDWEIGEEGITDIIWNRVWAKDKTVVLGGATKEKNFRSLMFKTTDTMKSFSEGIHVGSTTEELEKFLGASLTNVAKALNPMNSDRAVVVKGNIVTIVGPIQETDVPDEPLITITCKNGLVTEISMEWFDLEGCISQKAMNFANQKAKEMGMSTTW